MKHVLAIVGCTLFLSACATPHQHQGAAPGTNQAPKTQRVQQTAPAPHYNQSPQATADRLSELASRVQRVQGATSVVAGKWAVVGITVDPKLDRSEVGIIKYSVAQALKEDPQGATAVVTADPAIVQRLRELSTQAREGRPIQGVANELSDIVGRIIPQLPRDVRSKEHPATRYPKQPAQTNQPTAPSAPPGTQGNQSSQQPVPANR